MAPQDKLGIGIVGCGVIAGVQAQAIRQSEHARLVSVYSRNPDNARRLGEEFQVTWSADWDEFIGNDRIDVVSVCTPSGTHLDYGKLAAQAKKHVVVEKPIEVTLQRGQQLIDECDKNGVNLAVIFQNRYLPDVRRMKKRIEDGDLGKLFLGDAYVKWFREQAYYDSAGWRGTLALDGGGALINQAIHTIDLLQWMMGEVESIFGRIGTLTHERLEGEDNAVAVLQFRNGALGVIEGSTSVQPAMPRRLEIHGQKGTAILTGDIAEVQTAGSSKNGSAARPQSSGAASPLQGFSTEPHRQQFDAIAGAIARHEAPPVSGEEAMKSLAIVLAIYESARTNQPVHLRHFMESRIA